MFIGVYIPILMSPDVLSLLVVVAISSGLDVADWVVLHAADPLPN